MKSVSRIFCFTLGFALSVAEVFAAEPEMARSPEEEIAIASSELSALKQALASEPLLAQSYGHEPWLLQGIAAFSHAKVFCKQGQYAACVASYNFYLNTTQITDPQDYLEAQAQLGRAYYEIGDEAKSLRAYQRYISTFITQPVGKHSDLLEAVRYSLFLTGSLNTSGETLKILLSNLAAQSLPETLQREVRVYTSLAASIDPAERLIEDWLQQGASVETKPEIKALSFYLMGIMAAKAGKSEPAYQSFESCRMVKAAEARTIADRCVLAMARLSVAGQKPKRGLNEYRSVKEDSPLFRQALFERIQVGIKVGEFASALEDANTFTKKYQEGSDYYQVRLYRGFLELKNGQDKEAETSLQEGRTGLEATRNYVKRDFASKQILSHRDVAEAMSFTAPDSAPSPLMIQAEGLFGDLAVIDEKLDVLRNNIRSIYFVVAGRPFQDLNPEWENTYNSLHHHVDTLMGIGTKLTQTELWLYGDQVKPATIEEFNAAKRRREQLASPKQETRKIAEARIALTETERLSLDVAETIATQHMQKAELASLRLQAIDHSRNKSWIEKLNKADAALDGNLKASYRTLEILRRHKLSLTWTTSGVPNLQNVVRVSGGSFLDGEAILEKQRSRYDNAAERYRATELAQNWALWKDLLRTLANRLVELKVSMKAKADALTARLEDLIQQHDQLQQQKQAIVMLIEQHLGSKVPELTQFYLTQLDEKWARQQKWQAEVSLKRYQDSMQRNNAKLNKIDAEEQKIKERIKDLQQGILEP